MISSDKLNSKNKIVKDYKVLNVSDKITQNCCKLYTLR